MPFEPIATQEEFDERVKARLRRERERVMSEYSDYEDIKAAAADSAKKLDEQGRRIKELEEAAFARSVGRRLDEVIVCAEIRAFVFFRSLAGIAR